MRYLRYLLIAALIALAFYHLRPHFSDLKELPVILKNANYFFLFLGGLSIVGQYFGDGWLSKLLLEITGHKINFKQTIKIAAIDVFAAHMLPIGEAGVTATSAYFYKKLGVTNQGVIFLTAAWVITTNVVLIIFLLASFAFLPKLPNIPIYSSLAKYVILFLAIFLTILFLWKKPIIKLLNSKFQKYPIYKEIKRFVSELAIHKQNIKENKQLVLLAMLSALIYYSSNIASLYFCFMAFHYYPSLALVTSAYLLSLIVSFITLTPAGIGTAEAIMILVFLQFGLNPAISTTSVLAFRIFAFWLPIPAGFFSYMSLKNAKIAQTK